MAKQDAKKESIKLTTPTFRASFANVFKPRSPYQGQEPVYSVEMLFSKKEDITWLKKAIKQAAVARWGADIPKNFKSPLKDGDEKELQGYPGNYFITAKSKQKPGIVDKELNEIIDEGEFYSGCYARATIVVKAYSQVGNNGVSCYLQNLQKVKDGEAFSGKRNAKDDFDTIDELEDSDESTQFDADDLDI